MTKLAAICFSIVTRSSFSSSASVFFTCFRYSSREMPAFFSSSSRLIKKVREFLVDEQLRRFLFSFSLMIARTIASRSFSFSSRSLPSVRLRLSSSLNSAIFFIGAELLYEIVGKLGKPGFAFLARLARAEHLADMFHGILDFFRAPRQPVSFPARFSAQCSYSSAGRSRVSARKRSRESRRGCRAQASRWRPPAVPKWKAFRPLQYHG